MSLKIDFAKLRFDEDWVGALAQIIVHAASQTEASEEDMEELQQILDEFQDKLPKQTSLEPLLDIASEMSTVVMINIITDGINKIKSNNKELNQLAKKLGVQVKKINDSATLLKNIKTQIDKATKVVKTAKELEESLIDKDLSKIAKLQAIITALEGLSGIFT
ncbi:MAG: hypothetical protein ACR2MG_07980 [Pyrinomonadaceae bacterium]